MKFIKKAVSILLALLTVIGMVPSAVFAVSGGSTIDLSDGTTSGGTGWSLSGGVYNVTGNVTIKGDNGTSGRRVVISGGSASAPRQVVLDNVNFSANSGSPIALDLGANVTLTLNGANKINGSGIYAGIRTTDASLTIQGGTGAASLEVFGEYGAGIGGNGGTTGAGGSDGSDDKWWTVLLIPYIVFGSSGGAGKSGSDGYAGGTVTINSGAVIALSDHGAGIGGGSGGKGGDGGDGGKKQFSGHYNDGNGGSGGKGGKGAALTITGGSVMAKSTNGAAIGGGAGGRGGSGHNTGSSGSFGDAGATTLPSVYTYWTSASGTGSAAPPAKLTPDNSNRYLKINTPLSISLDPSEIVFPSAVAGYGAQAARKVGISFTGSWLPPSRRMSIGLSGANAAAFTLSSDTDLSSFTVAPKTGLSPGTYTATVTVAEPIENISKTLNVSFKVITYGISLDMAGTYAFPSAIEGYGAQTAKAATIANTGNESTGSLTVTLSGLNSGSFTLSKTLINSIAVGGTGSFTVAPKTGLATGTYTATVTVSGANVTAKSFNISFIVNKASIGITLDQTGTYTFPAANEGYGAQAAKSVTITNTGNVATDSMAISLSGANAGAFALSKATAVSLAAGGTDTFTVAPKTGLAAGTYTSTVTVSGAKVSASFNVSFKVNRYGVSLSTSDIIFPSANVGYSPQTASSVTITNTSNVATGTLNVTLSGADAGEFTLSTSSVDSINEGGTGSFTVVPKTNLTPGPHTATVTVSNSNIPAKSFNVSFTVVVTRRTGQYAYGSSPIDDKKDYSNTYYYLDNYFSDSSFASRDNYGYWRYNDSLATMSLCLELAAWASSDVSDYAIKSKNAEALLKELGFENFAANADYQKKPERNSLGAVAAKKSIDADGKVYTLIALAIRGGGYETEWSGNFNMGAAGQHEGFATARNIAYDFLGKYIADNKITGNLKVWLTGYSRGAATANLLAGKLDDMAANSGGVAKIGSCTLRPEDLYAFCFESPMGALSTDVAGKGTRYNNIINIVNPYDVVTKVAPAEFKFARYGVDIVLPTANNSPSYAAERSKMLYRFSTLSTVTAKNYGYSINNFKGKKAVWETELAGLGHSWWNLVLLVLPPLTPYKELNIKNNGQNNLNVYLDDFVAKLSRQLFGSRDKYVKKFQDDICDMMEMFAGSGSSDGSVFKVFKEDLIDRLSDGENLTKLIISVLGVWVPIVLESPEMQLRKHVMASLRKAGITYNEAQLASLVERLVPLVVPFAASQADYVATLFSNMDIMGDAHYPELCMAWLQSRDTNYTLDAFWAGTTGDYIIIRINCPVDVEVFYKDELVAAIIDDEPQIIDGSEITSVINADGEKLIYLPANAAYSLKLTATDDGEMTFGINEYCFEASDISRIINYYSIPITEGMEFEMSLPGLSETDIVNGIANGSSLHYSMLNDGAVIEPDAELTGADASDAYYMVDVQIDGEEFGFAAGQGIRMLGNFALLTATPYDKCAFTGWFKDGVLVSTDSEYRFLVTEDVTLTAQFKKFYSVAFVDWDGERLDEQIVEHGSVGRISQPDAPVKDGFIFAGWFLDGKKFDFASPIVGDVTVTAMFEPVRLVKSVTAVVSDYVATCRANIKVLVDGEDLHGREVIVYLSRFGVTLGSAPVTDGTGMIIIPAGILDSVGRYDLTATIDGVDCGVADYINVVAHNQNLWSMAFSKSADGMLMIVFADRISVSPNGLSVDIGNERGVAYTGLAEEDMFIRTARDFEEIPEGTEIVVKGVKYPHLFPSYSFTFTRKFVK